MGIHTQFELRSRIVGHERISARDLTPHPLNPAIHSEGQRAKLRDTLQRIGIARSILVYASPTHGPSTIIDGHMRADEFGDAVWDCERLDVTDTEAEVLISALDTIAGERETDAQQLADLLTSILDNTDTLHGTAHTAEDLDTLIDSLAVPDDDVWGDALDGVPEGDRTPFTQITYTLHDEQAAVVRDAIDVAKRIGDGFDGNANGNANGNALHLVCMEFLRHNHG